MLKHLAQRSGAQGCQGKPAKASLFGSAPCRKDRAGHPFSFPQDGLGWHFMVQGRGQVAHHGKPKGNIRPVIFRGQPEAQSQAQAILTRGCEHSGRGARGYPELEHAPIPYRSGKARGIFDLDPGRRTEAPAPDGMDRCAQTQGKLRGDRGG